MSSYLSIVSLIILSLYPAAAVADTLQGYAQHSDNHINLSTEERARTQSQPLVDSTQPHQDEHQSLETNTTEPQSSQYSQPSNHPIQGCAKGGQEEYSVNWTAWRHRVADAVWRPLKGKRIWGMTRVDYDVTRDHHIQITAIHTPDPFKKSGKILADAIMQLDGNPILEFPAGSKQMIHHNNNAALGLPLPSRCGKQVYFPGGTEHVLDQW